MMTPNELREASNKQIEQEFYKKVQHANRLIREQLISGNRVIKLWYNKYTEENFRDESVIDYIIKEYEKAGWKVTLHKGNWWRWDELIFEESEA